MDSKDTIDLLQLYKTTFSSHDGAIVLEDIMETCHMKSSTFTKDPYETAYREGQRSVVLFILSKIDADISQIKKRFKLHKKELKQQENLPQY